MPIICLASSHADTDLETIARLSAGHAEVAASVLEHGPAITGAVVLATCNRYEVYCDVESDADFEATRTTVVSQVGQHTDLAAGAVAEALVVRTGEAVTKHLFTVAAGLDSAVVGEREIAGQVRRCLARAQAMGTTSGALVRLFQSASRTARDVSAHTDLGGHGLSIVSVALDLAERAPNAGPWSERQVLLLGTGAYAGATMSLLAERGCTRVQVFSATRRAEAFVATRSGVAMAVDDVEVALARADVVIGCSGGQRRIGCSELASIRRGNRPLTMIDLALTRDIDPAARDLPGVNLIDLESVRRAAPHEQSEDLHTATRIVSAATHDFDHQQVARSADAAIVALRRHTLDALDAELERVRAQHGCTAAAEEVEFALRRMVRKLLHVPTARARDMSDQGRHDDYIEALAVLYGITVEQHEPASESSDCPGGHSSGSSARSA